MPVKIPTPPSTSGWTTYEVVLENVRYDFAYKFNERDSRWYFDLYDSLGEIIKSGVKIMEGVSLLRKYRLESFSGDIICIAQKDTLESVGLDNLGFEKNYALYFYTDVELEELVNA